MPDSPAPTTRTSRCSGLGASLMAAQLLARDSRRARGELVAQRPLGAEQHLAPAGDELLGVVVVRVEVRTLVVLQPLPHVTAHQGRAAEATPAATGAAGPVGVAVAEHR